jgi:hypothetical protein
MVAARKAGVLPGERREMSESGVVNALVLSQGVDDSSAVDGVPDGDGATKRLRPLATVPLVLVRAVPDLTQPMEENGASQRVSCLALVEALVNPSARGGVLHPMQHEPISRSANARWFCLA